MHTGGASVAGGDGAGVEVGPKDDGESVIGKPVKFPEGVGGNVGTVGSGSMDGAGVKPNGSSVTSPVA